MRIDKEIFPPKKESMFSGKNKRLHTKLPAGNQLDETIKTVSDVNGLGFNCQTFWYANVWHRQTRIA